MALTTHGMVNPHSSNESFTLDYAFEGQHPRPYILWTLQQFAALHESESGPSRYFTTAHLFVAFGAKRT
jgi:hypothetical protein